MTPDRVHSGTTSSLFHTECLHCIFVYMTPTKFQSGSIHSRTSSFKIFVPNPRYGKVFAVSGISLKRVWDSEFDCSREAGFAKIGHGMRDKN